jgi:transcriptional regulator with XRE-family HTH domain
MLAARGCAKKLRFWRFGLFPAGQRLRAVREELGLTIRDVESASNRIAANHHNEDFAISLSRLSDIETKGILPNIYRLYSLSIIYRIDIRELLAWYGVDVNVASADLGVIEPPRTHRADVLASSTLLNVPTRMDPGFDATRTANLGRMIERWGTVPAAFLAQFAADRYTYGYIGSDDYTMYPLLLPGSLIQVDESANTVAEGAWRSEYERPIYFVETREGHVCCWCALRSNEIILQPHPLSSVAPRVMKHPQDAEVIGQVVGLAMRLEEWRSAPGTVSPQQKVSRSLS